MHFWTSDVNWTYISVLYLFYLCSVSRGLSEKNQPQWYLETALLNISTGRSFPLKFLTLFTRNNLFLKTLFHIVAINYIDQAWNSLQALFIHFKHWLKNLRMFFWAVCSFFNFAFHFLLFYEINSYCSSMFFCQIDFVKYIVKYGHENFFR